MKIIIRKKSKKTKEKRKRKIKRRFKTFLFFSLLLFIAFGLFFIKEWINIFNSLNTTEFSDGSENLGISNYADEYYKKSNIINIALFGVDTRGNNSTTRADTIIIASFDQKNGTIKLISIMRDTFVNSDTETYGFDKINSFYSYGGPELMINVLNKNFDLNIRDYISVDFNTLGDIVDSVGGIELDITDDTIKYINKCIKEQNKLNPEKTSEYIKSAGKQQVNGNQALAYCRIRNTGNSDFDRVKRQKLVLSSIYTKVKTDSSIFSYMQICKKIFPKIQTSMQWQDLIPLAITYTKASSSPETYALTDNTYLKAGYLNGGVFYLIPDTLEDAAKDLHKKIYGNTNYSVSPKLRELSNEMTERLKGTQILNLSTDTTI